MSLQQKEDFNHSQNYCFHEENIKEEFSTSIIAYIRTLWKTIVGPQRVRKIKTYFLDLKQ